MATFCRAIRDALVAVKAELDACGYSLVITDGRQEAVSAGLLTWDRAEGYAFTDAGRDALDFEVRRQTAARHRRNAAARVRSDVCRSIGLSRTRSGGWE